MWERRMEGQRRGAGTTAFTVPPNRRIGVAARGKGVDSET